MTASSSTWLRASPTAPARVAERDLEVLVEKNGACQRHHDLDIPLLRFGEGVAIRLGDRCKPPPSGAWLRHDPRRDRSGGCEHRGTLELCVRKLLE
jgi:transposase